MTFPSASVLLSVNQPIQHDKFYSHLPSLFNLAAYSRGLLTTTIFNIYSISIEASINLNCTKQEI